MMHSKHPCTPGRRLPTTLAMLLVLGGCSKKVPHNPAAEIVNSPPTEINRERISDMTILVNGANLLEDEVAVTQGQPAKVTGRINLERSRMTSPVAMTTLQIRMLPPGTTEKQWFRNECTMEWFGTAANDLDFAGEVNGPPGEYEYRAYFMMHEIYGDLPTFDLIAKGRLTVLPAESGADNQP